MYRLLTIFTLVVMGSSCLASPPGGPPKLPRANAEAEQKLKEAYACYVQGWYERAFREEDYFILVPLDEACKVLGLSFRYKVNPKTGKRTGAQIGEKGLISLMGRPFARNIKGETDDMVYAPYEEGGVVWVPFYWLAKQAGIRWWEVRDGKIYVAPK
jgi:hypothetical protein